MAEIVVGSEEADGDGEIVRQDADAVGGDAADAVAEDAADAVAEDAADAVAEDAADAVVENATETNPDAAPTMGLEEEPESDAETEFGNGKRPLINAVLCYCSF